MTAGVGGLMLFGVPARRDATGSAGVDPDGVLNVALRDVRSEVGDATVVMADTCLDEFTDHGHCGLLDERGGVDNDATLAAYAQMAVAQADAGAHLLGPSGMMDGQVGVIRAALDAAGHRDAGILAYTAKYASAFYGPFREAVESQLRGDRKTYQQDAGNVRESLRELALDLEEGADLVMVKPAMAYLDVLRAVAEVSDVPVAAYQVSGEYAMIEAAAANGWLDRDRTILETLTAIRRAGADVVLTYWATEVAARLDRDSKAIHLQVWWRPAGARRSDVNDSVEELRDEQRPVVRRRAAARLARPAALPGGLRPAAGAAAGVRLVPAARSAARGLWSGATARLAADPWSAALPGNPPGYPAGLTGMPPQQEQPSFFGALFDFGFNTFATPVVIKVLYILGLVAIALGYVAIVISGFADSPLSGLVALIGGAVGALFYVIFFRVFLEFYYAVVRMSEDIRAMRNRS